MNPTPASARAGAFMLASLLLALGVLWFVGSARRSLGGGVESVVYFALDHGVSGLRPGDPVRLGGVKVSTVDHVDVERLGDRPFVAVRFRMPKDLALQRGARVSVSSTVTGLAWVNIQALGDGGPLTADAPLMGDAAGLDSLVANLAGATPRVVSLLESFERDTLPRLNATIERTHSLVERIEPRVDPTLASIERFASTGADTFQKADGLLNDSGQDMRDTLTHLRRVLATADERLPETLDALDAFLARGDSLLAKLDASAGDLQALLADGRAVASGVRDLLQDNRPRIDAIVASIQDLTREGRATIAEIRHSPWRLLHKPSGEALQNADLYAAARAFAEGAAEINTATLALSAAATGDEAATPERLDTLLRTLESRLESFDALQAALFEQAKD